MNTIAINSKEKTKKLIELPTEICRRLALQAAAMGLSVKKLMESIIINSIADSDDEAIYAYLCQTRPEGNEFISAAEQEAALKDLRKKAYGDEI